MGLFNKKDSELVVPVGTYLKIGKDLERKIENEQLLRQDVEGLLDCVIDGKKLDAQQLAGLIDRHNDYISKKITLNKLRKSIGLKPIKKEVIMNNIDYANGDDKTSLDLAYCGLRYGKTKYQAEQIKKYLEDNKIVNLSIHIVDSETKQKIDKISKLLDDNPIISMYEDNADLILEIKKIVGGNDDK